MRRHRDESEFERNGRSGRDGGDCANYGWYFYGTGSIGGRFDGKYRLWIDDGDYDGQRRRRVGQLQKVRRGGRARRERLGVP